MLDDLKMIHERDVEDALGIAGKQWQQLLFALELSGTAAFDSIDTVVYAGMGGSALAASFVRTWPVLQVPFEVVRDYGIPEYVNGRTLVILCSYSGNTEETMSALRAAEDKGAQIVIVASGGKLLQAATEHQHPYVTLPKASQPRYAVLYGYRALLTILGAAKLVDSQAVMHELETVAAHLETAGVQWSPAIPTASNPAKQLAQELMGKSIVVYGGPKMYPAAYKWKISFNENAKHVAWAGQYPEFNHNEFIGWSKQPVDKPYAVIDLRSTFEHERVQKRFEVSARLLSGMRPEPHIVQAEGKTVLEQLLWTMVFGDFVSLYLALLNGLNPAPVDLVEKFKLELAK